MVTAYRSGAVVTTPGQFDGRGIRALYQAVAARDDDVLAYCDRFGLHELPEDARNLLNLLFSFVMVSFPVEVWNGPRIPDAGDTTLDRIVSPTV